MVRTVLTRPGLPTWPASRFFSSLRTALFLDASVLRFTWRRSGVPSGRVPIQTKASKYPLALRPSDFQDSPLARRFPPGAVMPLSGRQHR